MIRSISSIDISSTVEYSATAASLTQLSSRPKRVIASCASRSSCGHSATSVTTAWAMPPAWSISLATSFSAVSLRASRTTDAPRLPNSSAVSRPMPDDAPVMTTTCSLAWRFMGLSFPCAPFSLRIGRSGKHAKATNQDYSCDRLAHRTYRSSHLSTVRQYAGAKMRYSIRFWVNLLLSLEERDTSPPTPKPVPAGTRDPTRSCAALPWVGEIDMLKRRVLLVEDHPMYRKGVK